MSVQQHLIMFEPVEQRFEVSPAARRSHMQCYSVVRSIKNIKCCRGFGCVAHIGEDGTSIAGPVPKRGRRGPGLLAE